MTRTVADRAAENAARNAYGRLVAILSASSRDIAAAEDALSDALFAALSTWPDDGVPLNPEGWLLTAARNRIRNQARHRAISQRLLPDLQQRLDHLTMCHEIPDERLRLMFICAHPAIEHSVRTALMLQTILGIDAARIAAAFMVAPVTMGQRLVRAKAKIRDAGLPFELPTGGDIQKRANAVFDAIYAAFGTGWAEMERAEDSETLASEAIYLCRVLVSLLPREPEAKGLLALMLYASARREARQDAHGHFVPLDRQDARLWNRAMIVEAENLLTDAAQAGRFGRYQCEAAIQSVHVQRAITGVTNYDALVVLYDLLFAHAPSVGASIGRAVVVAQSGDAAGALNLLAQLPAEQIERHQPYWVARARILEILGQQKDAALCLERAEALTPDVSVVPHLTRWRDALMHR